MLATRISKGHAIDNVKHSRKSMAAHHYVSKFHLREFCDPSSLSSRDPWLWVGSIKDARVKRRSPKNVGTATGLFDGPGGFENPNASIEKFLANEVEGPAASALRKLRDLGVTSNESLPAPLMRYLAWAASRSVTLKALEMQWSNRFDLSAPSAEPPPAGLEQTKPRERPVRLVHPTMGRRTANEAGDIDRLLSSGWVPDPDDPANFLEGVHTQQYYFQARWFPRLRWFTLRPPTGKSFIIGDRPVGWGTPDCLNAPPSCLRDPSAFLIAPLCPSLALVARNDTSSWSITPEDVNGILALWSHDWIAGPTQQCVADAINARRRLLPV
jgi:hypothetical protein